MIKPSVIFGLLFFASGLSAFWISSDALLNLPYYWGRDEYSHGVLVPVISCIWILQILSRHQPSIKPSWYGLPLIIISLLLSAISELAAFEALLNYSFLIALFGLVLCFLGKETCKKLLPAMAFLFFAVPLPHIVYGNLSINMQLISSTIGTEIIRLFGYSVFQDGNIIDLGIMKLQVVEACSGLRYLFPLMSIGYLVSYYMHDRLWKKIIIFLSVIPVTIFMNSFRIAVVGVTVNMWGQEMAEGFLHAFEGFVIFAISLVILMAEAFILLRIGHKGRFRDEFLDIPKRPLFSTRPQISTIVCIAALFCIGGNIILQKKILTQDRIASIPASLDFEDFPMQLSEWKGKRDFLTAEEIKMLDLTDYWIAEYNDINEVSPVNLYIAYYDSQRMRANIHIPLNCIIGAGWQVIAQEKDLIEIQEGLKIPVVRLTVRKQSETLLVYYWLDQRGRQINSPLWGKYYLALDALTKNRTDGALVRITTPIAFGEVSENAETRIERFLQNAYPTVQEFIPQ
ncbi:MAG: VPLPA-CTERM-specific exosortase XrtD [Alphaproteobacteria bacterium]